MMKMPKKPLIAIVVLLSVLVSLALIFILPSLVSPGHLELYDVEKIREVDVYNFTTPRGFRTICYLRWHWRETVLEIEEFWRFREYNLTVEDEDTFILDIPTYSDLGYAEIRYDDTKVRVYCTGKLKEVPWHE